jgi:hypothetical protein
MTKITSSTILSLFILSLLAFVGPAAQGQHTPGSSQDSSASQATGGQKEDSLKQQDADAKKTHTLRPLIDNPGTKCLDYTVDVVPLTANNLQMFWKQGDCILVHVTNNPFLFKYDLTFNEQLIHEDDPLSAFGKIIGVNVSSPSGTSTNTDKTSTDKAGAQSVAATRFTPKFADDLKIVTEAKKSAEPKDLKDFSTVQNALSEIVIAGEKRDYGAMEAEEKSLASGKKLEKLAKGNPTLQPVVDDVKAPEAAEKSLPTDTVKWRATVGELSTQAAAIGKTFDLIKAEYRRFSNELPAKLLPLGDAKTPLDKVQGTGEALQKEASQEFDCLTDGIREGPADNTGNSLYRSPSSNSLPGDDRTLERRLLDFVHQSAALHKAIQTALASTKDDVANQVSAISDDLHAAGERVAYVACAYKGFRDNDLASLNNHLIVPLNSVLSDGFSYGYQFPVAAKKREGPFGDPTGVTMTLKRSAIHPFATGSDGTPTNTTSSFTCSSDTTDMFDHGASYNELDDFFTDKPVEGKTNTYTRNLNKPTPANKPGDQTTAQSGGGNSANTTKPATTSDNGDVVLVQPWFFGKARLVVSGGLSTGFLGKKEFQRSSSISGTGSSATSSTVIGVKTDTRYRLTPMLYGHTLLGSSRHDGDAWYATLGVTANSDSKGTSPEFLLGGSRSFAQQKFFATLGAYIGEQQKLDGGLQVGQTIPSTLTGELPVTKSYHASWGFGISYRFASTKDPQKDSSAPAKPSSGAAKKTSN